VSHQELGSPDASDGGPSFDISLSLSDLGQNPLHINITKPVIIRTGFSTHTMNMGQRHIELDHSFTSYDNGSATLHVAQMEPNPAILAPGPALFFVVVNGVPSNAVMVMIGDGIIGQQTIQARSTLPRSTIPAQLAAQYGFVGSTTRRAMAPEAGTGDAGQAITIQWLLGLLGIIASAAVPLI